MSKDGNQTYCQELRALCTLPTESGNRTRNTCDTAAAAVLIYVCARMYLGHKPDTCALYAVHGVGLHTYYEYTSSKFETGEQRRQQQQQLIHAACIFDSGHTYPTHILVMLTARGRYCCSEAVIVLIHTCFRYIPDARVHLRASYTSENKKQKR